MDAIGLWSAAVYTAAFLAAKLGFAAIRREHGSRTPKGGCAAVNIVVDDREMEYFAEAVILVNHAANCIDNVGDALIPTLNLYGLQTSDFRLPLA